MKYIWWNLSVGSVKYIIVVYHDVDVILHYIKYQLGISFLLKLIFFYYLLIVHLFTVKMYFKVPTYFIRYLLVMFYNKPYKTLFLYFNLECWIQIKVDFYLILFKFKYILVCVYLLVMCTRKMLHWSSKCIGSSLRSSHYQKTKQQRRTKTK